MRMFLLASLMAMTTAAATAENAERQEAYRQFALVGGGDARAGERLYREDTNLACTNCHRITGAEKSGPNLDGIAQKYSREELIRHVLEPSESIKPGYEQVVIHTQGGRVITGRISRATRQMVRVLDAQGASTDVARADMDEMDVSTTSLMPDNLVASISKEQFADLIAYLETLRLSAATGFRGPNEAVEIARIAAPVRFAPIHAPDERFANPVWCGAIPGLPGQMAVLEQQEAKVWRLEKSPGGLKKHLFLDLKDDVKYGNNWGLMCLAFHPQFASNRRYFLKHEVEEGSGTKTTIVARSASADLLRDSGVPSRRLLELEQPAFNHNGGCVAFGPDGMLYAAFGDGGPQRDPNGYSQDARIFHGSMIRIDVDGPRENRPYAIPADNPFRGDHERDAAVRPETWAIGFREPWRFSFDSETGDLWLGDVGQDKFEEVCLVKRGENHGWNVFEGYEPFSDEYRREGEQYTWPLFAYPHSFGVSVTGGHVYRGSRAPSFVGVYIFGDYETRRVWGLRQRDGEALVVRHLGEAPEHIASFGVDDEGEIYVVGYEGTIFHVDLAGATFK